MKRVIIFTKPNCPPCDGWKNAMKSKNIPFREVADRDFPDEPDDIKRVVAAAWSNGWNGHAGFAKAFPMIMINKRVVWAGGVNGTFSYIDKLKEWRLIK